LKLGYIEEKSGELHEYQGEIANIGLNTYECTVLFFKISHLETQLWIKVSYFDSDGGPCTNEKIILMIKGKNGD